jgi:hypothetical protein
MTNRIDTEELLIELYEIGIDTVITANHKGFTIEFVSLQDNTILATAKGSTVERALTNIIKNLILDVNKTKDFNVIESGRFTRL